MSYSALNRRTNHTRPATAKYRAKTKIKQSNCVINFSGTMPNRLPIITVIINDRSLGMVEQWQRLMYNRRYIGIKFPNVPDFVKLTEAYGAHGKTVGSLDEFGKAMREGLANEGPTVIEVPVSPEEDVYPFLPPGKSIKETVYGSSKEMAVF